MNHLNLLKKNKLQPILSIPIRFSGSSIHKTIPICKNCKFFIANTQNCRRIMKVDLITGKKIYNSAEIIRYDKDKCGGQGKFFEKNNFKMVTVPYYFLLDIFPVVFASSAGLVFTFGMIFYIKGL